MKELEFYYDFGSPNAYFSYKVLPALLEQTDATLVLKPVLLGGIFKAANNQSPFVAMANIKGKLAYEQLEIQRFIAKHNLADFQFNPNFPVNTLQLMRGACIAEKEGFLPDYTATMMSAMWERGLKMDDTEVIKSALEEAGLPAENIIQQLSNAETKEALINNTETAVERGVFGVPTFFIGSEMWFGKERLTQIEDHLNAAE